jgi:hypothetical protein
MAKNETWMPMTAGILDIICGCWQLLIAFVLMLVGSFFRLAAAAQIPPFIAPFIWVTGIPFAILGILSIVGGVFALSRKAWGLALAGSITALFAPPLFWLLGITAIVFTALSKNEFE